MELTTLWFILIAVLWVGYFVLEGFDFGVGMLLPIVGRTEPERRALLSTIGPVWDGNEVWLIVAGGATFAAFPEWYASLFSGLYLALFLVLVALIVRGAGIEYRNKRTSPTWRRRWDVAITISSWATPLLWGVAFANLVAGLPVGAGGQMSVDLLALLGPVGLLGGATLVGLCLTHGAVFLSLKTEGDLRQRAHRVALPAGLVTAVLAVLLLSWVQLTRGDVLSGALAVVAAVALVGGLLADRLRREGLAFAGTAIAIGAAVLCLFAALFPDVLPSSIDPAYSLTTTNAASTPYTLSIMTAVVVLFLPFVLLYQGWTYWVFRKRIKAPPAPTPSS